MSNDKNSNLPKTANAGSEDKAGGKPRLNAQVLSALGILTDNQGPAASANTVATLAANQPVRKPKTDAERIAELENQVEKLQNTLTTVRKSESTLKNALTGSNAATLKREREARQNLERQNRILHDKNAALSAELQNRPAAAAPASAPQNAMGDNEGQPVAPPQHVQVDAVEYVNSVVAANQTLSFQLQASLNAFTLLQAQHTAQQQEYEALQDQHQHLFNDFATLSQEHTITKCALDMVRISRKLEVENFENLARAQLARDAAMAAPAPFVGIQAAANGLGDVKAPLAAPHPHAGGAAAPVNANANASAGVAATVDPFGAAAHAARTPQPLSPQTPGLLPAAAAGTPGQAVHAAGFAAALAANAANAAAEVTIAAGFGPASRAQYPASPSIRAQLVPTRPGAALPGSNAAAGPAATPSHVASISSRSDGTGRGK